MWTGPLVAMILMVTFVLSAVPVSPTSSPSEVPDRAIVPRSTESGSAPVAEVSPGEVQLLSWFQGGYHSDSWIELHLDADVSIQFALVTYRQARTISGSTATNFSVSESSIANVNTNLAYFNHSLSNGGDMASYVYRFTRSVDAFGDPQINLTGSCASSTNYTEFNVTMGIINVYPDSDIDTDWWLQAYGNETIHTYNWVAGSDNIAAYHGFKTIDDRMILAATNSFNFWQHIQTQMGDVISCTGYWSSLVNDRTWAREYDVDGRLMGGFKVVTPQSKQRFGNVLVLLPRGNSTMLDALAHNESIYARAASAGMTHVYLETFDIIPGQYTFATETITADVKKVRNYTHKYGMKLILPSFWWAFTEAQNMLFEEYSEMARGYVMSAWKNYLTNQGPLTDEYSIGFAYIWPDGGPNGGNGWSWWNLDMLQEAMELVTDQKNTSLWCKQMWFIDESITYLNTEGYQNWNYNSLDAYYAYFDDHDVEPGYEMCGMKTWAFTSQITVTNDTALEDLWSQANYTFEKRVLSRAFHHGAGLSIFYHEYLYSDNDGFSLTLDYMNGLKEDMVVTSHDVPGIANGTMYEGSGAIMLTGDLITPAGVELDRLPTAYLGVQIVEREDSDICNISLPDPYRLFVSSSSEEECNISLSAYGATLHAKVGELYSVLPIAVATNGTAAITIHEFAQSGPQIASWRTSTTDLVTYTLTELNNTVGYRVYQGGSEIFRKHSGSSSLTFTAAGGGEFKVRVWRLASTAHERIFIDGNSEFTSENGVLWGSGAEWDPYIIEGWHINASAGDGISVWDTDAYLIVRECYVHDGAFFGYYNGIFLLNCMNVTLENNTCSNNNDGMILGLSSGNYLRNNNCSNNGDGIFIGLSSNSNTLSNNTCSSNQYCGIFLESSSGNTLMSNQLFVNSQYGVRIHSGSSNVIWNNTFYQNNGAGSIYDSYHIQAYDDGSGNWWNGTDGRGNYWSDWTVPNEMPPYGIVDVPYDIAGSAAAKDYCPLTNAPPEQIPEFDVVLAALCTTLAVVFLTRRRRTGAS